MDIDYVFKIDYGPMVEPIGSLFREHLMITEILPEMLAQVRKHFERDGINETKLIAQCKTFKDEYIIKNRIPTARDRKKIEKNYRQITPYRIMVEELSVIKGYLDHLPILRDIYEAMQAVYNIINKHYYSTVGNPNLGQRLRAIVDEYRKNQDIAPSTLPGFVDVSKEEAPVIPIPNNIESCTASCESTPAISGHDDSKKDVKTTEAAAPTTTSSVHATANATSDEEGTSIESVADEALDEAEGSAPVEQATDLSHMRSFTPVTKYNMSALYQFLVDEHVVVGVDEKQFADCINQANIEPLWETTESKNLFKLFLHTLKKYYQEPYQRQRRVNPKWFLVCCESIDVTTEYMGKMNFPKGDTRVKFCENMELCIKTIT